MLTERKPNRSKQISTAELAETSEEFGGTRGGDEAQMEQTGSELKTLLDCHPQHQPLHTEHQIKVQCLSPSTPTFATWECYYLEQRQTY